MTTPLSRHASTDNLDDLIHETEGLVRIACDTEFRGPHTLAVQFSTPVGQDSVVQVFHSPAILPGGWRFVGRPRTSRPGMATRPSLPETCRSMRGRGHSPEIENTLIGEL